MFVCVRVRVLEGVEDVEKNHWNHPSFTFLLWLASFSREKKRIQPQRSILSPDGQDFLHGVKSHGGWLIWEAMTHSLRERAEFILDLQSPDQSSATQSSWHYWRKNIIIISQKCNPSMWKISLIIRIN